ncbi:MAG: D-alanyl-D-alanine carboxypeptidase [Alphaproteobacteria bacterium]|nr:D-alanyl-D-alanine carboxypeptidase [Alphaproteobacteria bacterium]
MLFEAFRRRVANTFAGANIVILAALLSAGFAVAPPADARTHKSHSKTVASPYETGAIVINEATGEVLYAKNPDEELFPASMTKVMTLYLTFEALRDGRLSLDTPLKVSQHASTREPSKLWLPVGSTITVENAILAIVTKSANDVASVLAEAIGGTEDNFAMLMTAKARELGMRHTLYRNASGLPDKEQVSTPRDMAVLGVAIHRDFPDYYAYFATRSFKYGDKTLTTHNRFVENYKGADGIKTGYIGASGFNLLAAAERHGVRLVGVVFGGRSAKLRDAHMADLMDASFALAAKPERPEVQYVKLAPAVGSKAVAATAAPAAAKAIAAAAAGPAEHKVVPVKVAGFGDSDDTPHAHVVSLQTTESVDQAEDTASDQASVETASLADDDDGLLPAVSGWAVQVGAFSRRSAAVNFAHKILSKLSDTMDHVSAQVSSAGGKRQLYRSRLVGFNSRSEAQQACAALKRGKVSCILVAPGTATASLQ